MTSNKRNEIISTPWNEHSPFYIGHPKRKQSYSNHSFSGAFAVANWDCLTPLTPSLGFRFCSRSCARSISKKHIAGFYTTAKKPNGLAVYYRILGKLLYFLNLNSGILGKFPYWTNIWGDQPAGNGRYNLLSLRISVYSILDVTPFQ